MCLLTATLIVTQSPFAVFASSKSNSPSLMGAEAISYLPLNESDIKASTERANKHLENVTNEIKKRESNISKYSRNTIDFVTIDEVSLLSTQDFEYLYDLLIKQNYNEASLIKEIKKITGNKNSYQTFNSSDLQPNYKEKALINKYPAHGVSYMVNSTVSRNTALSIYTDLSCWHGGNGDAFRHILWIVNLYIGFQNSYGIDGWYSSPTDKVATFATTHEDDSPGSIG